MRNKIPIDELMRMCNKHETKVGVTQLSNPIVLGLDKLGLDLAVDTVGYYMSNSSNRGRFEDVEGYFWEHFKAYYAELRALGTRFSTQVMDVTHLLSTQVKAGGKADTISVRTAFVTTAGKFPITLVGGKPSNKTKLQW